MKVGAVKAVGVATALLALAACAPEPRRDEPLEIETVEVGAPVDAGLSTEDDEQARPPSDSGWILTGMLPEDLPLHRPARLVDSGEVDGGRRYFVFHTTSGLDAVKAGLAQRLREAGWAATAIDDRLAAEKGGDGVDFFFAPLRPGTEIRVVY